MFGFLQSLMQGASSIVTNIFGGGGGAAAGSSSGGGGSWGGNLVQHPSPSRPPTPKQFAQAIKSASILVKPTNQAAPCLECQNPFSLVKSDKPIDPIKDESLAKIKFFIGGAEHTLERKGYHSPQSQCVDLIKEYYRSISGNDPGSMGNGWEAANNFATKLSDQFDYEAGGSSINAPKIGSVISIERKNQDSENSLEKYGHTGVVQDLKYDEKTKKLTAQIFDQNIPANVGYKSAVFTQDDKGNWSGVWVNRSVEYSVEGWANPK